jgi:lipopolysaccharide transport system ATP-binding protein
MSDIAIRVENLGKQYRIGALQRAGGRHTYKSLRDSIAAAAGLPLRAARRLVGQGEPAGNAHDETFWALKDVSFDIKHGEIVGVIGRNGAGKSTLLKLLSRITEPTTGRVEIRGRVGSLLEVGTGFHPELSGRDNVYMNGAILGMKRAEIARQFDEIVAFAEVEKFIDTPVKHYSSGMYLRLAFAVAAHLQTEILIVDEVLAVGDAQFQKKCLGKMKAVSYTGRAVLLVSHNIESISRLCTRGIVLRNGAVTHDGTVSDAIKEYKDISRSSNSSFQVALPTDPSAVAVTTQLQLEDPNAYPNNNFSVGDPWQVRVSITVRSPIRSLIAGIGITNESCIPIWTVWSEPQDIQPGNYEFIYSNREVNLSSGSYAVAVGLSTFGRNIQYVEEAANLEILPSTNIHRALVTDGRCGFIINQLPLAVQCVQAQSQEVLS